MTQNKISYISPTSFSLWETDPEQYYVRYFLKGARQPQNLAMAAGSAFDAYVKSYLYNELFGKEDPRFEFKTLFEIQVESQNRDWALVTGQYLFNHYNKSGALGDLLLDLRKSKDKPRFEFEAQKIVNGVPLMGRPDLAFYNKEELILCDFKVNGFLSKRMPSPARGYIRCRDVKGDENYNYGQHPKARISLHKGIMINISEGMETINSGWANQLSIYNWILDAKVGDEFIAFIDQIACGGGNEVEKLHIRSSETKNQRIWPMVRVAEHRSIVGAVYQLGLMERIKTAWEIINSDHLFRYLSPEESKERKEYLKNVNNNILSWGNAPTSFDASDFLN